jgi:hypothetical protein
MMVYKILKRKDFIASARPPNIALAPFLIKKRGFILAFR